MEQELQLHKDIFRNGLRSDRGINGYDILRKKCMGKEE